MKSIVLFGVILLLGFSAMAEAKIERIFREPRHFRGNTNVHQLSPIDGAGWLWHPADAVRSGDFELDTKIRKENGDALPVMVFENQFEVIAGNETFEIDVSADERFYLTVDGEFIARGPNRADVENWQFQSYRLTLTPGKHVMRAVVTRLGRFAPLAQLSWRGGFALRASGKYDKTLSTRRGVPWKVAWWKGMKPAGVNGGAWGTGSQFEITGSGPYKVEVSDWVEPVTVRGTAGNGGWGGYGSRTGGWLCYPTQIPDQTEIEVAPGEFRAATHEAMWRATYTYKMADTNAPEVAQFNALLKTGKAVKIPAHTRLQLAWHLGRYICAYPRIRTVGGKAAKLSLSWTECPRDAETKLKGHRAEIVGKYLDAYGDTYVSTGGQGEFSSPWFRCGLWCRLDLETADEPLEITGLTLLENRYPLEMESEFSSVDDPSLGDIRRICARALQMCCHEMFFDCPFYEQQMYPGDTRVEMLVTSALTRDDRIIKRGIEIFDYATRDDGMCPFNYPTRGLQEGFTYTQCYLLMYGDYAMNHADREWLKARLPGMRKSMAGCELYENAQGLIEKTPGWNFMDWTVQWHGSWIPNSECGRVANSFVNLMWLLDMQSAIKVERALGNEYQVKYWEEKAARLKAAIIAAFWDEERGLFADTGDKKTYSEHSQAMAIIAEVLPRDKAEKCFKSLIEDQTLARTTVYFSYYLFEAYFKMGRADLFQHRLDMWRDYVARGLTTLLESPDAGRMQARSDCHAWGAHPIWFMQTGLAGIKSDAPFFAKVLVAPQPGTLKQLKARHPHPNGWIEVELSFEGSKVKGKVVTPVPGTFRFGDREVALKVGENEI